LNKTWLFSIECATVWLTRLKFSRLHTMSARDENVDSVFEQIVYRWDDPCSCL